MKYVKTIPCEFQHTLVVAEIGKRKISNIVRKTCTYLFVLDDLHTSRKLAGTLLCY